jgi:homoserine O-acetyltransferase/O-succinyltransferase
MSVTAVKPPHEPPPEFPARKLVTLPQPLRLYRGGSIARPVVAYESWGTRSANDDNTVLLFTGLSPSAHAASSALDPAPGWWESMIGESRPIDTRRWHVVCVNSLGSPFGSSSPASIDPASGRPYGTAFPELAVEDIASAAREALRTLGISRVACVVGPSLGGMTVLAYCVQYPDEVDALISISGAVSASAQAIALRALQREIVRSDPHWRNGAYEPGHGPRTGLRLARKLGTITYRGAREFDTRFGRQRVAAGGADGPTRPRFEIESYLEHQAQRFSEIFDANCFLALSCAMDEFDLAEHGRTLGDAFARFSAMRALVIGVETDILFPLHQQREVGAGLEAAGARVEFHAFPSAAGHDSFLVDLPRFEAAIGGFLRGR